MCHQLPFPFYSKVMIVMELMPDGDLRDNLLNMKPT